MTRLPLSAIDKETKTRFRTYRTDPKFDAVSNDRVRQLALIDSIKAYIDNEVYDEVAAVRTLRRSRGNPLSAVHSFRPPYESREPFLCHRFSSRR